jgi:hypothetical protein
MLRLTDNNRHEHQLYCGTEESRYRNLQICYLRSKEKTAELLRASEDVVRAGEACYVAVCGFWWELCGMQGLLAGRWPPVALPRWLDHMQPFMHYRLIFP